MSSHELTPYELRELEKMRKGMSRSLPPLPVNRLTEHIEEDLAYRAEFTAMKGTQIGRRLAEEVADLHWDLADKAQGDPILEQLLNRIEATVVIAGTDLIANYMDHVREDRDRDHDARNRRRA